MKQPQRMRLVPTRLRDFGTLQHDLSRLDTLKNAAVEQVQSEMVELHVSLESIYTTPTTPATPNTLTTPAIPTTPATPTTHLSMSRDEMLMKSSGGFISLPSLTAFPDFPDRTPPTAWLYSAEDSGEMAAAFKSSETGSGRVASEIRQAPTKRRSSAKKLLGLVLRIGGTLVLTYVLLKSFSWQSLFEAMEYIKRGNLLVAVIVGIIGVVLSCYQWRSVLQAENIRCDLADLIDLYVVGIAFSHFLPTGMGGDAIKAVRVGQESGNSAGSASAVVMCRVTGFFAMLLIAIPVLLIWHDTFDVHLILWFAALALLVGTMIGVALLCAILLPRLGERAGKSQGASKWLQRVVQHPIFASTLKIGNALYASLKKMRSVLVATLYGALFWVSAVLNCYTYADAIGIHAPLHFYFLIVPFISLIAFLPISINGYGLRESAFVYAFSTVSVSPAQALLLALLLDAQGILFGLCGGCIYLALGNKQTTGKKRNNDAR